MLTAPAGPTLCLIRGSRRSRLLEQLLNATTLALGSKFQRLLSRKISGSLVPSQGRVLNHLDVRSRAVSIGGHDLSRLLGLRRLVEADLAVGLEHEVGEGRVGLSRICVEVALPGVRRLLE